MKKDFAKRLTKKELDDLNVPPKSIAFYTVMENALEASEILTTKELKQLISDHLDILPRSFFLT